MLDCCIDFHTVSYRGRHLAETGKPDISEIKHRKTAQGKIRMVAIVGIASMGLRQFLCSSRRLVAGRCIKIGTIYLRSAKRVTAGN